MRFFRIIKRLSKNRKVRWISLIILLLLLVGFWFSLPEPLFDDPASTVLEDQSGRLLSAKIADDGQWRFPLNPEVPEKFKTCIIAFEDQYFMSHPGVNLGSLLRATVQNIREREVVSGGSTLSMQVIRLSRKGKPRTVGEKLIEMVLALRLELRYSKSEILALYAAYAPFGGNVVGLDAASWRYYGRPPGQLSWAESAMLAVLPNAPSLIYPGKNQQLLLEKRNRLLSVLFEKGVIDEMNYHLSLAESLPDKPASLDQKAPHLLTNLLTYHKGERIKTTLDANLQDEVSSLVDRHQRVLSFNKIYNAAALVVATESGEVRAWVGNAPSAGPEHGEDVDMVTAQRSTGSILKPLLYAAMLDDGLILPNTLIADVPTQIGGFRPLNFDKSYSGAVPAQKALYQSLNVPAVKMLQQYGVARFRNKLREMGMSSLNKSADHYGLSLILGGAEVSMLELATMYSSMSRTLNHFYELSSRYDPADIHAPNFTKEGNNQKVNQHLQKTGSLSAASIWFAFDAMRKVNRPEELSGWESFTSSEKIAWKTGTSFGFRDAWAVGVTRDYVVIVWVGNADGEGRPGLTGVSCAAPLMFDIFNLLPKSEWFDKPYDEWSKAIICRQSGHRAGQFCDETDTLYIPVTGLKSSTCPYHQLVHLDPSGTLQVTDACIDPGEMVHKSWFVLPPVMEWYYRKKNPLYKPLPEFSESCKSTEGSPMEFVYPGPGSRMFIPVNLAGKPEAVIIEIAHSQQNAMVYWHLDDSFLGETTGAHQMEIRPEVGWHTLTIVDNLGNSISKKIEILNSGLASRGN
ncbi:MAG: penicillin-binding protein 1C [Bacteroidales bacterium]|nr:penicillin-binding protein 1C [Bacteroidales bacterium]